jgi:putative dimethyl sulfoxide reductase chaperone
MNETTLIKQWRQIVTQDLRQLAILHSRELSDEDLNSLKINGFPNNLGFLLPSENGKNCLDFMKKALANTHEQKLDELATDFTGIYLNHYYRVSPCESVWFDDENLMLQEAMFAIREWYSNYGLQAENWRIFPDDHFILQIQFVAYLLELDENKETLLSTTRFLDEHLLRWISKFAAKVSERCTTEFYAGLNILTAQYLEEVRDMLAVLLEIPRPTLEEVEKRLMQKKAKPEVVVPLQYMPGVFPSW